MTKCRETATPECAQGDGRTCFRRSLFVCWNWLSDMDSNHDSGLQRAVCYHYTIGQTTTKLTSLVARRKEILPPAKIQSLGFKKKSQVKVPKRGVLRHCKKSAGQTHFAAAHRAHRAASWDKSFCRERRARDDSIEQQAGWNLPTETASNPPSTNFHPPATPRPASPNPPPAAVFPGVRRSSNPIRRGSACDPSKADPGAPGLCSAPAP
jgi:hypothetical protein